MIKNFVSENGISWTWKGNWPDAGGDKCVSCGVPRKLHGSKDHSFKEREEIGDKNV